MNTNWNVYMASQNLPAVLNDPNRGKQTNFFTKTWGDTFIDGVIIEKSPFLPDITYTHFELYIKKIGKRYKKHLRTLQEKLKENITTIRIQQQNELIDAKLEIIPQIFLESTFKLNEPEMFAKVFHTTDEHHLQENLSHYLDIIEVQIARQVSIKSGAFFHAMTSHDTIMEQMGIASNEIKQLREKMHLINLLLAKNTLKLMGLYKTKCNHQQLVGKLKLMAIVLQTQPTIQLLLSSSDYVAALELIANTQEVLKNELIHIKCLRHLPSQLKEMTKLIDKMLNNEFERYATNDLHRPLDQTCNNTEDSIYEPERLISLIAGLLKLNNLQFIKIYKQEAITAIQTILKQILIDVCVEDNNEHCLTGLGDTMTPLITTLDFTKWLNVLHLAADNLQKILRKIQLLHDLIRNVCIETCPQTPNVESKLQDLLDTTCDYSHERLANLISTQSDKQIISTTQITELSKIIEKFSEYTAKICGKHSPALRATFKIQAGNFVLKFHNQRKNKLASILDTELWKAAKVPTEIQLLIDNMAEGNTPILPTSTNDETQATDALKVNQQNYVTVGAVLILIWLINEYCVCANDLPLLASVIGRHLIELLKMFNSRACQLVLGVGALRLAGLKTITTTNLALTSRSLQLILWMLPYLRAHFAKFTTDQLNGFDTIEENINHHIQQLETKIVSIITQLLNEQLNEWDAKPPVPSTPFRNISKHLIKLHEAVSTVLPEEQVIDIYEIVHRNFKTCLKGHLIKLNIENDGGPQHGGVSTEIFFYLETMKSLKVLPAKYFTDTDMNDIWNKS